MGGVFEIFVPSKPKAPVVVEDNSAQEAEEKERERRAQRSGYSNVNTSYRGLFAENQELPKRKTLLGE
ncbi:MAG: hypothetical protein IKD08_06460 [Alphaproteobacteria bacterium]|nr:hypothetical protein [Alphaproteobacteria bacterium]